MRALTPRLAVAACILLLPLGALAANQQSLRHSAARLHAVRQQVQAAGLVTQLTRETPGKGLSTAVGRALGLSPSQALELVESHIDGASGKRHVTYRQFYKGVPLWSSRIIVTQRPDGRVQYLHGDLVTGLAQDVHSVKAAFGPGEALSLVKRARGAQQSDRVYSAQSSRLVIWLDDHEKAHLAYAVTYFTQVPGVGDPARPMYLVDAHSGKVLYHFNALTTDQVGTGPGGNEKVGEYFYGTDYPKLDVTVSGGTCIMNNAHVKTVDLNNGTSGTTAYSFGCYNNPGRYVNGAYSALNDAHFFGGIIYNMYSEWYNTSPLTFQLVMRVHYGNSYENAFWNGSTMNFGDGATTFYPLVALDVAGHEISHGFTEQHAGLVYDGQSGGINESFSDMAGETAEYYRNGSNDWLVGYDITKGSGALRSMSNPPSDGRSIDNANDYYSGLDVHYSSGVFNKAFYLLATTSGWTTRKAFDVFIHANENYWSPNSGFQDAAQGATDAAADFGYDTSAVAAAFANVGIQVSTGGGGGSNVLDNGVPVTVSGAQGSETVYTMDVPSGATDLTFQISGGSGDADLYVKFGSQPTTSSYDCRPYRNGNSESCSFASPQAGTWYVMLRGYQSYSNVSLEGSYTAPGSGGGSCPAGYTQYTGSLASGGTDYQPNGNYYYSGTSGTHSGRLYGPSGTDFDLYLQKWNGSSWVDVAQSISSTPDESIDYNGTSGYYAFRVHAYSGSGSYSFCLSHP